MAFIKDKYKFVDHQPKDSDTREIIAISSFQGKTIKGRAKCHPEDLFNSDIGEMLAALRCNQKICEKRYETVRDYFFELKNEIENLSKKIEKVEENFYKAEEEYEEANNLLQNYIEKII